MHLARKLSILGTILAALLLPGLAAAADPPNSYYVIPQVGDHCGISPAPGADGKVWTTNGSTRTFTITAEGPTPGFPQGFFVAGYLLGQDPAGPFTWHDTSSPQQQQKTVTVNQDLSNKNLRLSAGAQSKDPNHPKPYGDHGPTPTPMWGTAFRTQDPQSLSTFNDDGTLKTNPVEDASPNQMAVNGVTYKLKKLKSQDVLNFQGQNYVVYSAVPLDLTIDQAYRNAAKYYDPKALGGLDFTIPATINGGNPTTVNNPPPTNAPVTGPYTGEQVYTTVPPEANSQFFVPNLPNTGTDKHEGLTANVYFVIDPFIHKPGYMPDTSVWPNGAYHLVPYGWAWDPRTVVNPFYLINLDQSGGGQLLAPTTYALANDTPTKTMNYWKHTIQGVHQDKLFQAVKWDSQYPFPYKTYWNHYGDNIYPHWLKDGGLYAPVQPMPGFQRNLIRWYTSWGAANLLNQTSDLFIRKDGTVELPAVNLGSGNWRYAPVVTQTWDGSQRHSVLNLTNGPVPSTYDVYPGAEYYLPGNVYLPGKAGVATTYVDYEIFGDTGLVPRETDLWMGLKGDTINDIMYWGDAPVNNLPTEPGGQANKPYMFGGFTNPNTDPATKPTHPWLYKLRLQSSNSFLVARLPQSVQGQLYDASFYADLADGKGYQLLGTISYRWQPWSIDASGKWAATKDVQNDNLGAGVPQLTYANPHLSTTETRLYIQVSSLAGWGGITGGSRVINWGGAQDIDPAVPLDTYANKLTGPPKMYWLLGTSINKDAKFLIVLTAPHDATPATSLLLLD